MTLSPLWRRPASLTPFQSPNTSLPTPDRVRRTADGAPILTDVEREVMAREIIRQAAIRRGELQPEQAPPPTDIAASILLAGKKRRGEVL